MTVFDAIVIGAGPAGSTAALRIAQGGGRVLLLDKARFPRDKPCGGGITGRAAYELGIDLAPVVERSVSEATFSFRGRRRSRVSMPTTFIHMTQRSHLDAYLVEQAVRAGAEFRDGQTARSIDVERGGVTVRVTEGMYQAETVIGADGANGITSRCLGLHPFSETVPAIEGNIRRANSRSGEWEDHVALDFGPAGGYGLLFPKTDHVNVGVGGWGFTGTTIRAELGRVARVCGLNPTELTAIQGHLIPLHNPASVLSYGRALVVGDAAGMADPLSYEGIYGAVVSAKMAAMAVLRFLGGEGEDLSGYGRSRPVKWCK